MKYKYQRPAIAMIELIFAIVIMGIVMMGAPMLISTASNSTIVALQQEGINEAVSRVNAILSYEWDQSLVDTNYTCPLPVLHVTSGDTELEEVIGTSRRAGVSSFSKYRTFKCGNKEFNATAIGKEGTILNDIDDFTGTRMKEIALGTGGTNYIEYSSVNIETIIDYTDDSADYSTGTTTIYNFSPGTSTTNSTNIKAISVILTSDASSPDELDKEIKIYGFSANIGGLEFESRGL